MQLVKCCLYYLRKEGGKKGSFQTHWPSLLLLLPANVGWVLSFFLFNASAFCCVSKFFFSEKNKNKKEFGTPPKVLIPFCSIDHLNLIFLVCWRRQAKGTIWKQIKSWNIEKKKREKKTSFCFVLRLCVWTFFYRIFFFFWPARPCMGSNSRLTAESVVPPHSL